MRRLLLGVAIGILPFTSAFAATALPQAEQATSRATIVRQMPMPSRATQAPRAPRAAAAPRARSVSAMPTRRSGRPTSPPPFGSSGGAGGGGNASPS